ncbi:MAG: glycosyltransferase, partial [Elusimicrobiota bacterium]
MRIGLINPQGHVRWNDLQIAEHPDTGGQIVYITELSKEIERLGCKLDLFTRYFKDPEWPGYDKEIEQYSKNLRIIRIKCGPRDKFIKKEELWPYINEYVEGIINFYKKEGIKPDILSSHYGDGGLAAAILKKKLKKPFTHTGHSLGGKKMDNLRLSKSNFEVINKTFKFHLRIMGERISFRNSNAIVTSTKEEIKRQYSHRVYKNAVKEKDKFNIIPPGISEEQFFVFTRKEKEMDTYNKAVNKVKSEIKRYIDKDRRNLPCIFSAARFDAKKNPAGLLKAYAASQSLQENMNLIMIAGKVENPLEPKNLSEFKEHEKLIIEDIIEIISESNLKGKVCFSPGFNYVSEMPFVYRYGGRNQWIFINPAIHEPFGLTVVEAMASGLPVVATENGGPSE